jgi:hypothetical protein
MLAIGDLSNTVQFIFYAIGIVAFALAALAIKVPGGDKVANLVALGLFAVFFPTFWSHLAAL